MWNSRPQGDTHESAQELGIHRNIDRGGCDNAAAVDCRVAVATGDAAMSQSTTDFEEGDIRVRKSPVDWL
jgi:hypothetical protein